MIEDGPRLVASGRYRLEKRLEDGTLFEVVEGELGGEACVTMRRPGLAPAESYSDLPVAAGAITSESEED